MNSHPFLVFAVGDVVAEEQIEGGLEISKVSQHALSSSRINRTQR